MHKLIGSIDQRVDLDTDLDLIGGKFLYALLSNIKIKILIDWKDEIV